MYMRVTVSIHLLYMCASLVLKSSPVRMLFARSFALRDVCSVQTMISTVVLRYTQWDALSTCAQH
jgi:hypothetical protein